MDLKDKAKEFLKEQNIFDVYEYVDDNWKSIESYLVDEIEQIFDIAPIIEYEPDDFIFTITNPTIRKNFMEIGFGNYNYKGGYAEDNSFIQIETDRLSFIEHFDTERGLWEALRTIFAAIEKNISKIKVESVENKNLKEARNKDNPSVYVASLSDYNDGKTIGDWFDLTDYSDDQDFMEAIYEMLEDITKKARDGEEREEYIVLDYENFPREYYSQYMSFDDVYDYVSAIEELDDMDIDIEVYTEWYSDHYGSKISFDEIDSFRDAYIGEYDDLGDAAEGLINMEYYRPNVYDYYMTSTDQRLHAQDIAEMKIKSMSDEEILEESGNMSEYEDLQDIVTYSEDESEVDRAEKNMMELLSDARSDYYIELSDDIQYEFERDSVDAYMEYNDIGSIEEMEEEMLNGNTPFVLDTEELWDGDMRHDFYYYEIDNMVYVFRNV